MVVLQQLQRILFSLTLLIWSLVSFGQESNIVQFSIPEGLPQSQVNKILFDSRGMLWVATSGGGIASFDGNAFTTLDEKRGLAGNIVLDLEEDLKGKIYTISSWGGISVINKNKVEKVIPFPEEFTASSSLEKDGYGNIWMCGSQLYYLNEKDEFITVSTDLMLPFVVPANMKAWGEYLYITNNNTVIVVDVNKKQQVFTKTYDFNIQVVLPIGEKTWYIGTEKNGLYREENGELSKIDLPSSEFTEEISITDAFRESATDVWFSSRNGVYHLDGEEVEYYEKKNGFDRYDCTSICFDAQGNVWFGTRGEGVIGIVNTPFTYFTNVEGLNKSDNFPVIEDELGRIWVGNNEEGIFIYDGENVESICDEEGLISNKVRAFCRGFGDDMLVGTGEGLSIVDINTLKVRNIPEFSDKYVKSMIKKDSLIYLGMIGGGIYTIDENYKVKRIFEDVGSVASVAFRGDDIVFGNGSGCYYSDNDTVKFTKEGLLNTYIGNIAIDKNGKIWVGTDREIGRLDGNKFRSFTESDGLASGLVYILYSDQSGFLWVGTNKGLDRITLNSNSEITKIRHFGYAEGFKGIEVNSNGIYENPKGELYFATIGGLHKYVPSFDYSYSYNTPVYVSGVKLFLEDYHFKTPETEENWFEVPSSISLEHDQNHVTFEFFAVDYLNPQGIEYTYYLEGFDKKWSPPTKSRYAVYSHIPPGNYVFKVKQAGNDFSQVASINLYIQKPPPPFYKKVWFMILVLAILGLMVYYFTEYRTAKLKNQQLLLESKIEERTLEILESEKEKTILLQEVHHRVKNNLQIIISLFRLQSHFTDNEEALDLFRNSQNRVRSMSKIHEKLYETKDLSKIEIKSYLIELVEDLVESYDINNEVNINHNIQDCEINLDELTPLALIINEIITNSLKYGLKDVTNPTINIELSQNEIGFTQLRISDNGPGFDQEVWDDHKSMGVELIKTLTEQLDGEIKLSFNHGHPVYELKFKASM